jgi:hypothetical protein
LRKSEWLISTILVKFNHLREIIGIPTNPGERLVSVAHVHHSGHTKVTGKGILKVRYCRYRCGVIKLQRVGPVPWKN